MHGQETENTALGFEPHLHHSITRYKIVVEKLSTRTGYFSIRGMKKNL
jgi:hypothetical protein